MDCTSYGSADTDVPLQKKLGYGKSDAKRHHRGTFSGRFAFYSIGQQVRPVAQAFLQDGIYKTRFETGISNGLMAVQPGSPRDEWERHLFHGAYQAEGMMASQWPRYGALDLLRNADGLAPRIGSCFFIIKSRVAAGCTCMFGGFQERPRYRGAVDEIDAILAALMEESLTRDSAPGVTSHNLDHVIEAQIHGEVLLGRDAEALVVDLAFRGASVGQHLCEMVSVHEFPSWHLGGFISFHADEVPPDLLDFLGPTNAFSSKESRAAKDRGGHGVLECSVKVAVHSQMFYKKENYDGMFLSHTVDHWKRLSTAKSLVLEPDERSAFNDSRSKH